MDDTLGGNGLFVASSRLTELANDSAQLARARDRFSDSPPSYRSQPSGTTTRSQSLNPPTEEEQRYEQQRVHLTLEYDASRPREQWDAETVEEAHRIIQARVEAGSYIYVPGVTNLPPEDILKLARKVVRKRWIEQGIWNDKWKDRHPRGSEIPCGPWKHQEPLDVESESESEARDRSLFSWSAKPKKPKSEEELRLRAERLAVRAREREASRPFHRFIYHVSAERERIQEKSRSEGPDEVLDPADINTKAYENVKSTWVKRGIWNRHWGILPGMNWKHEQNFNEMLLQELGPKPVAAPERGGGEVAEATSNPRRIFGPPSPTESSRGLVADTSGKSQRPPANLDQGGLQHNETNNSPPKSNQPQQFPEARQDGQDGPSETAESPRQGDKAQPPRRGRARQTTVAGRARARARGPSSPAKVSKSQPKKTKSNPLREGKKASSSKVPPVPQSPQPPAAYTLETPRRSRRLQEAKSTGKKS